MGLPGDDAAGEAGIDDTGVGRGVGSLRPRISVSDRGKVLSGNGDTAGQLSNSPLLSAQSVDEVLRGGR